MTNYEIAQEINTRIGDVPVTDSLYEAALTIYQQLGGEVSEFDDVYSILQSIKEIARPGGDPITKVSVLPKSGEEYETKFLRTPDDKIYATGKVTMPATYTNRLPDAQQIDKAYLWDEGDAYYYKGAWKLILSDGEIDGFAWSMDENSYLFTLTNCGDTTLETLYGDFDSESWNVSGNTASTSDYSVSGYKNDMEYSLTVFGIKAVIPATYNAPEEELINTAYLFDVNYGFQWYYDGTEGSITIDGETYTGYKWLSEDSSDGYILTDRRASDIYYYHNEDSDVCYSDVKCYFNQETSSEIAIEYIDIPQLNASDAEQVGKAYINAPDYRYTYTGEQTTITVDGEELSVYVWDDAVGEDTMYSNKRASEIYNTYKDLDDVHFYCIVDGEYVESTFEGGDFYEVIRVEYQRLDKPQSALYGWQQVTVNGLILDEPVSKRYLLRGADLPSMRNEYGLTLREAWVNFNDETYTFNGKTYYKWIKYDDVYSEWEQGIKDAPSIPDSYMRDGNEIWILTTTLTPKLPFTLKSPECAYVITTNGETAEGENYIVIDRECPKMAIEYTNGIISYFD